MMPIYDKIRCSYCGKEFSGPEAQEDVKPYNHECKAWKQAGRPGLGGE